MSEIEILSTSKVNKIKACPASIGPGTKTPKSQLDRWVAVFNAINDWYFNDAPEEVSILSAIENNFAFFDDLQKKICEELFENFRNSHPDFKDSVISSETSPKIVEKEIGGKVYGISSAVQFEIQKKDKTELVKMKISNSPVNLLDASVLHHEKSELEENLVTYISDGEVENILPPENSMEVIEEAFRSIDNYYSSDTKKTNPGLNCYYCNRPSRCGQFPELSNKKTKNTDRGILVSKTQLLNLNLCERKAAWKAQYGIPPSVKETTEQLVFGIKFHEYTQQVIAEVSEPFSDLGIEKMKKITENEEEELNKRLVASFRLLIEEVSTYKNINLSKSEFELGFTTLVSGLVSNSKKEIYDGNVAVTYMGKADFVGRLDGNVPLVVELKTGKERDEHKLEADLYAIGAKTILKEEKIIVLHIYLDTNSAKVVERVYETKDFAKLNEFFISKALVIGSWDPEDSLSPAYTVGSWCEYCEFKTSCIEYRNE